MNKPLSYESYSKGNKKLIIRYIATIMITAVILGVIQIILDNVGNEICKNDEILDYVISIKNKEKTAISEDIIKEIESVNGVEYVIPKKTLGLNFVAFASTPDSQIYAFEKDDIDKFLEAIKIDYDLESINSLKENETYITNRIVKNLELKKGDKIDDSYDITYKDQFTSDLLVGVTPVDLAYGSDEYMIIVEEGKMKSVDKEVKDIIKGKCIYDNDQLINKVSLVDTVGTFNAVKIIITITCAIATGVTTYLHYFNRRKEIGVLKAIGYSDRKILFRISKEISMSSIIALILSIGVINTIVYLLNRLISSKMGYLLFEFDISMLSDMMIVVLSIMVFSLVPTWILLKSVDKISLIEGR